MVLKQNHCENCYNDKDTLIKAKHMERTNQHGSSERAIIVFLYISGSNF